ncbi:MAG: tRNA uridine-5-carboxymethylaminomethyl(34) synthesis GTPase MnmE [Pseudomonadota bacterium]|nr:tRNA uridine-5-carboxymethylaminomethyl(34) synthesis GTPase MnmE [Pseudomonadota bacterium]
MSLARREDPIVAVATASGRGAIGIVRVSGAALAPLIEALCGQPLEPRRATYVAFRDANGEPIDHGLAIYFPAPHSYSGEDVLELQAHGGPVVLQLLLARCLQAASETFGQGEVPRLGQLRIARPGEFTERAYLNGKLDLAQAEAVADLIDASTEAAARSATRSLSGVFSVEVGALHERLVELRMLVEATLDFPDEEVDFLERAGALRRLAETAAQLERTLAGARRGALLRAGMQVVLVGQPNVGKSSLLNALAGAERAIVTAIPGTTRDKVEEAIQIEGVPVHVVDTAGLREGADEVERIGVERAWAATAGADVVVFLHDLTRRGRPEYDAAEALLARRLGEDVGARLLHVDNKADAWAQPSLPASGSTGAPVLVASTAPGSIDLLASTPSPALRLSALTGVGLDALRGELLRRAGWQDGQGENIFIARARHVDALERSRSHLLRAIGHAEHGDAALELVAEELRAAHDALAEITGEFSSEDLLGVIFGRFCIGK